jgi:hypothetical protein
MKVVVASHIQGTFLGYAPGVVVASYIQGTFLGYAPGIVHRLDGGSEWEQTGETKEYVYRQRPGCRVFWDRERLWLDVEGTSGVAQVRRYTGKRWAGPKAF